MAEHRGALLFTVHPFGGVVFSLSTNRNLNFYRVHFQGAFYAILRYFGRNLTLWTISCYRPKQGAFHDKSLISTPKNGHEQTKKSRRVETALRQNDAEQSVPCAYSPNFEDLDCILAFYRSINAKKSPHALYQNMRTQLVNLVNYDMMDDALC